MSTLWLLARASLDRPEPVLAHRLPDDCPTAHEQAALLFENGDPFPPDSPITDETAVLGPPSPPESPPPA